MRRIRFRCPDVAPGARCEVDLGVRIHRGGPYLPSMDSRVRLYEGGVMVYSGTINVPVIFGPRLVPVPPTVYGTVEATIGFLSAAAESDPQQQPMADRWGTGISIPVGKIHVTRTRHEIITDRNGETDLRPIGKPVRGTIPVLRGIGEHPWDSASRAIEARSEMDEYSNRPLLADLGIFDCYGGTGNDCLWHTVPASEPGRVPEDGERETIHLFEWDGEMVSDMEEIRSGAKEAGMSW